MFVFPVPEPPIINILYGWSGVYGQLRLCITLFSLVYSSKLIIYNMHYPAIFAVLIPSKVMWHNYLICCTYSLQSYVTQLFYLLYLFLPNSCDTIILFALSLVNFAVLNLCKVLFYLHFMFIEIYPIFVDSLLVWLFDF